VDTRFLFDFQAGLVEWAIRQGRAALFADCGLGKTPMQLAWAENVHQPHRSAGDRRRAARGQLPGRAEAAKFGIEAGVSRDGSAAAPITVTNYDRLHLFDPADFSGAVCDESSAIKSFDGKRRALVTDFMRKMRYRLLCTATAAPNDYIELGTSSEALGYLGYMDMLGRFFVNDQRSAKAVRQWSGSQWRFKGHAEDNFWRWVSSWGARDATPVRSRVPRRRVHAARARAPGARRARQRSARRRAVRHAGQPTCVRSARSSAARSTSDARRPPRNSAGTRPASPGAT
jgi:hypothetical protein